MSFKDNLPRLARKGFDKSAPNQFLAIHPDILKKLTASDLLQPAITLLLQLGPDQKIQYVTLEELKYRDLFLEIGFIKPTKKVGKDLYVVPKNAVQCSVEKP